MNAIVCFFTVVRKSCCETKKERVLAYTAFMFMCSLSSLKESRGALNLLLKGITYWACPFQMFIRKGLRRRLVFDAKGGVIKTIFFALSIHIKLSFSCRELPVTICFKNCSGLGNSNCKSDQKTKYLSCWTTLWLPY